METTRRALLAQGGAWWGGAWASALLTTPASAQAPTLRWDLATGYPESSFHVKNLHEFAADINARTNGQLTITVHAADSFIKTPEIRQAVIDGRLAVGEVFGPSLGAIHPVFALDAVPFLSTSYEQSRKLWNLARPLAEKKAVEQGFSLLYSVPWPPQGLFSAKEIKSASDLKNVPLRENSPYVKRLAEILEAEPTRIETPELAAAVKAGRVKAVFTSAAQGVDTRMWETLPWFYPLNAWLPRNAVLVNRAKLDALPPTLRDHVLRAAAAAEERGWTLSAKNAVDTLASLKASGAKIGAASGGMRARLDRAAGELTADVLKRSDTETVAILSKYLSSR
jgi:TRAP-type transport system periplasmic protein